MLGISDAAESIGLRTAGVRLTWEQLLREANLPCIVHWNQHHFVVVYKIKKSKGKWWVYVSDPAAGLLRYGREQFLRCWMQGYAPDRFKRQHDPNPELDPNLQYAPQPQQPSQQSEPDVRSEDASRPQPAPDRSPDPQGVGLALLLEPTPKFYQERGDEDTGLKFGTVLQYLRPYRGYLAQLAVISLILPFLTQAVVDTGIGTGNLSFVVMILVAQCVLVLGQMANNLIRSWLMLHMTTRISISLISDFLCKLMHLPIAFFDSKMIGDIMQRIGDYNRIQSFLTGSLLSIAMAVVSLAIYGVVMAGYDVSILGVFLLGSVLYVGWILIFLSRRRKLDYMRFQQAANNQSNLVQLIGGMQDIKLNNCETQKRWEWERIQARLFRVSVKGLTLGQTQEVGGMFIDQTKNVIISFIAASAVIDGQMTLGMMMAMQYIIGQLNAPLSQFIGFVQASQDAKISLERLGEIHDRKDEEPQDEELMRDIPGSADIEFRNVVFQYDGPHSAKVLDNISLLIPHDRVTAIVGESGSGKTTLLKMMLGFYPPAQGEVLLGGRRLSTYSPSCWRRDCGVVMQEGYIFSDTIAGNIGVSDERPDMGRVRRAVETTNIGDFIDSLPLGYNTKIGADRHGTETAHPHSPRRLQGCQVPLVRRGDQFPGRQ